MDEHKLYKELNVSDHALVRYLERVEGENITELRKEASLEAGDLVQDHELVMYLEEHKGYDITGLRHNILTDKLKGLVEILGNGKYPIHVNGFKAVIRNKNIVTITPSK